MGKLKNLHIDCTGGNCVVNQPQTCPMMRDNDGDYNPWIDEEKE